jgi:RNA polymerase sigma-70 factor (ECF subfamily)
MPHTVNRTVAHRRHGVADEVPGAGPDYVAIVAALRRIPAEQRRAIVLHHLVGLSVEEVANETGARPGTVKARLSRGRQAMAPYLTDIAPGGTEAADPDGTATATGKHGPNSGFGPTDQEVSHHG